MNWIERIVDEHKEFESPLSFWRWAAICAISAVVKDNIWMERGGLYKLYPNIYVMFHADSGLKKGPPVNFAGRLVKLVNNTEIIEGRYSIQGLLKKLGTISQAQSTPGGKVVRKKSVAFICSSELTSSIVEDKVATDILTDLYDRHYRVGQWRSLLKMEEFDLVDPTITMLTATNESHADTFFAKKDIKGGFLARTFIIYESEENRSNSLLVPSGENLNDEEDAKYLRGLMNLSGSFKPIGSRTPTEICSKPLKNKFTGAEEYFSPAGLRYEIWYTDFKESIKTVKDPTGTLNRFGDTVLKVAMLLSLGKQPELVITEDAMEEAITLCEKLVGNVRHATLGKTEGETTDAVRKTIMIHELMARDNHMISRAQLIKKYWIQGNNDEWDRVALTFQDAGMINIKTVGNHIVYEMTEQAAREWMKFFGGKV